MPYYCLIIRSVVSSSEDSTVYNNIRNAAFKGKSLQSSTGTDATKLYAKFSAAGDGQEVYEKVRSLMEQPTTMPVGWTPVAEQFKNKDIFHGFISRHSCTHEDSSWIACSSPEAEYQEYSF